MRRNQLLILPAGARFMLAGTAPDPAPRLATNTLARASMTEAVVDVGGGLVASPRGLYAILAEDAYDESEQTYRKGATLYLPPGSPFQPAAKVATGGAKGGPRGTGEVVPARPYPTSAKAMASGIAMTAAAFTVAWVLGG